MTPRRRDARQPATHQARSAQPSNANQREAGAYLRRRVQPETGQTQGGGTGGTRSKEARAITRGRSHSTAAHSNCHPITGGGSEAPSMHHMVAIDRHLAARITNTIVVAVSDSSSAAVSSPVTV